MERQLENYLASPGRRARLGLGGGGGGGGDGSGSVKLKAFDHGQSNPTYLVTVSGSRFVLRKQPAGQLLSKAHDVIREARIIASLSGRVAVPKILIIETDSSIIGTPFAIMEYIDGVIHRDPSLPEVLSPDHRRRIYRSTASVLASIHAVRSPSPDGGDSYSRKQLSIWAAQYKNSLLPALPASKDMTILFDWLERQVASIEQRFPPATFGCLSHGDFRLDNLVLSPDGGRVLAVLDWELAVPGGLALADLAYCCLAWYLPKHGFLRDLALGQNAAALPEGIPTVEEFVQLYCDAGGGGNRDAATLLASNEWTFFLCLGLFRIAAICQGVFARSVQGNASSSKAPLFKEAVPMLARCALDVISRRQPGFPRQTPTQSSSGVLASLQAFLREQVLPAEAALTHHHDVATGAWPDRGDRWKPHSQLLQLAEKARIDYGLWNLWLPRETARFLQTQHPDWKWAQLLPAGALSNADYAEVAVATGFSLFTPSLLNCSAPDTGNMELLANFGSASQRERWLLPLLTGEARSCFAMTERDVSSSDPTQLSASATLSEDGKEWILNGRKWWTTGACDPRCKVCLFVARTATPADGSPPHRRHSIFLVPMDAPGVTVLRPLLVFGYDDAPGGHAEVEFVNVRVDRDAALLGKLGRGFELAQSRLGPGRLHHCARLVGHAQRALEEIKKRGSERQAFGKKLLELGGNSEKFARAVIACESAKHSVLAAARELDVCAATANQESHAAALSTTAQRALAICKVLVPDAASQCLDFAVQLHGGGGLSSDHPLAAMWAASRTLRLVDGPDEVHLRTIAKLEKRQAHPGVGRARL